jgi:RNA polymerase sigma-70 factor, ECF subfamily
MTKSAIHAGLIALLPRLRRFALVLARNSDAADDLVQASVERALSRESQWQPDSRLDRWMFQIMRTVWLNSRRAAVLRQTEPIDAHIDEIGGHDGVSAAVARLTIEEVRRNFAFLPHEQQQAMMLVCVEGYTYAEAADLLGIPMGTVISRLTRGRMTLMARQSGTQPSRAAARPIPSNVAILRRQGGGP